MVHVFEWHKIILEGRKGMEGDEQLDYPVTVKTNENVKKEDS
jgi:hypothetical protein